MPTERKSELSKEPGLFRKLSSGQRKFPDFLIVGTQKGGTSMLYRFLVEHSQIAAPLKKEVHFFDTNYGKGFDWYKGFMPLVSEEKLAFEATPYYLFHPLSPLRIAQHLPNVKIIILLRDPVRRAFSHFQMQKKSGIELLNTFEEALEAERQRIKGEEEKIKHDPNYNSTPHAAYSYVSRGMYFVQLTRWMKYFKREQLLILKSENFFKNPCAELEKVAQFLSINNNFTQSLAIENKGDYFPLDKEIQSKIRTKFKADTSKLRELLGDEFVWE